MVLRVRRIPAGVGGRVAALLAVAAIAWSCPAYGQDGRWRTDFSRRRVPLDEIIPGGPPRDGIPAIDRPAFDDVQAAGRWLSDREPVVVVVLGEEVRVYPLQILIWHEIVNDVVAGVPIAVTFCPLCNTALTFEREVGGRVLEFGTTGLLRRSDLVMYDRQTESWWQQATGEAIVGAYAGQRLRRIATPLTSWRQARRLHPAARVLARRTGYDRPYGRNPYEGYDRRDAPLAALFRGRADGRLPAMERVVAIEVEGDAVVIAFSRLQAQPLQELVVGGVPLVVVWQAGTASALDAADIGDGRDVGATVVFDRRADGRVLSFEREGLEGLRDRETGTRWDLAGRARGGPLVGQQLSPVPHGNHFWFALAAFRPDARLIR